MAKCKCGNRPRIVSNAVQSMSGNGAGSGNNNGSGCCVDVCTNPICADPSVLSLMAPLIYDEIGINLCASFAIGTDIATTYPTVTNATLKVINAIYGYGTGDVLIESITGRPNCYVVTLSNITIQFAMDLYDAAGRLVATVYPTALFLPADTSAATYDEDTNPSSVELEIFAPYGLSYNTAGAAPTPIINFQGFAATNNYVRQGLNLYAIAKILDFSTDDSTVTAGLTLVLQSLYFAGYQVNSAGKIDTPKGSILTPDNSDCMRFVAGDLLNLAIKPLDLGAGSCPEQYKQDCNAQSPCSNNADDDTVVIPGIGAAAVAQEASEPTPAEEAPAE